MVSVGVTIQQKFHALLVQTRMRYPELYARADALRIRASYRLQHFKADTAEKLRDLAFRAREFKSSASLYAETHREQLAMASFTLGIFGLIGIGVFALQPTTNNTISFGEQGITSEDALAVIELDPNAYPEMEEHTDYPKPLALEDALDVAALPKETAPIGPALEEEIVETVETPKPTRETKTVKVKSGDTLMGVLLRANVERREAYYAIEAMKAELDPRKVRSGQEIEITLQIAPEGDAIDVLDAEAESAFTPALVGMRLKTDVDKHLNITRASAETSVETFLADIEVTQLQEAYKRAKGRIESSLFVAAEELGIPHGIIVEMIRMYSYDVDFQREIRAGDEFEILYSQFEDTDGNAVKTGNIYFGNLALRGKENPYYRFITPDDQIADYYNALGQSAKKFLMKTPVDGARLSSGFGKRKHPVLGYVKSHKGTDFAAPTGTPIMAAGNGTVERASRFGSFGNYIKIRHANGYKTAYAHLNGYAKGIKKGARVKQGQIIGYVGTTGRSTGPHLHYEVHLNGKAVNPMTIRVPTGRKLEGDILTAFKEQRDTLLTRMAEMPVTTKLKTAQLD